MSHVKRIGTCVSFLLLSACTAKFTDGFTRQGSYNNSGSNGGGNQQNSAGALPSSAFQDKLFQYTFTGVGTGYTYSLENAPTWMTVDPTLGKVSGVPADPGTFNGIKVIATKGSERKELGPFTVTIMGDPLAKEAWHLGNTGQRTFAQNPGVAGQDMKAKEALATGYSGVGVKVAVSDTGMEIRHDDLKDNVSQATSKNYAGAAPYLGGDPSPTSDFGDHGTSVSGIIGARAWNNVGARGIAPEVVLSGVNFLGEDANGPYQIKPGVFLDQVSRGDLYDVYNQSWGSGFAPTAPVNYTTIDATYEAQVKQTVTQGRGGKGTLVIRAAGNDFQHRRVGNTTTFRARPANGEEDNALPYMIVVGAMNAKGLKASYSSHGAALWISGLAGEFGSTDPAILTTDVMGCNRGYSQSGLAQAANTFELGQNGNTDCKYTTIFNGTSSATPSVVGVVALMLQANPNLGWRDVKHILAKTATKVDAAFVPTRFPLDPANYISEPGWLTNRAGYNFHNYYGFGRADAKGAVDMAKTYTSQLGTMLETATNGVWKYNRAVNLAINDNNPAAPTAIDTIAVTENWIIEAVQIEVSVTHPFTGDIGIELVAPSGTKSVLFNTNNSFSTANLAQVVMLSNAFYGEAANGNWQIRVLDGAAGNTGTLTNWKLNILGHAP